MKIKNDFETKMPRIPLNDWHSYIKQSTFIMLSKSHLTQSTILLLKVQPLRKYL